MSEIERPRSLPQTAEGGGVQRRVSPVKGAKGDPARETRIKAALKANLARRKVQAKVRGAEPQTGQDADD